MQADHGAVSPSERSAGGPAQQAEIDRLLTENRRLADEVAELSGAARVGRQAAWLHAARAAHLWHQITSAEMRVHDLQASSTWRAMGPVRAVVRLARGGSPLGRYRDPLARTLASIREDGPLTALRRMLAGRGRRRAAPAAGAAASPDATYRRAIGRPAATIVAPRVLLVAELSIPQCAKYRVWQKQEHLERLGVPCSVVDWHHDAEALSALQTASLAIFYRVPATPAILDLVAETRRLGVAHYWEVDDLVFDEPIFRANRNVHGLAPALQRELLDGVRLYRQAMLACDRAIASTEALAAAMRAAGMDEVRVVENALDDETLETAASLRRAASSDETGVLVTYGSGTRTHDVDFASAAPALATLLRERPQVRLRIVGELTLPDEIARFGARVETLPKASYRGWLGHLSECQIALAPLEDTVFNDAKSNIKYLEASILGIPTVSSPRANFRNVIEDGVNGLLAETPEQWLAALIRLTDDPALRRRIGEAASRTVLDRFAPAEIARRQVEPLVQDLDQRSRPRLRVLVVNVFFAPRSFGGATIVAEELARRLHARPDTEVNVFTSHQLAGFAPQTLLRYEHEGMPVYAVRLSDRSDAILDFDNPGMADRFAEVMAAVQPDIVHFHSIQALSAAMTQVCRDARIPYVITAHDAWWLCERQFMVRGDGVYCFQTRIDLKVCAACLPHAAHLPQRLDMLAFALDGAAFVLAPSRSHGALYAANGIRPERLLVEPNGIRFPAAEFSRRAGASLRFGYVGGNERVKGFALIREAFEALARADWELVLVDNTLNLGFPSIDVSRWEVQGRITVAPAYRQDGIDAFFAGIDVLLFPSQWKESFGLTVREALARDVWVVATDCGGPIEDIVDGVNGTIVPMDGRADGLQAAVEALLDTPEALAGYRNPHKDRLRGFDVQAERLHAILGRAAGIDPAVSRPPAFAASP